MTATITVAICTRDRPESLARTLHAVRGQTDPDFEVVIVDQSVPADAGADAVAAADHRFRVVRDGGDGLSRSRNQGWQAATTEWVAYLDDDVVPDARWIEELRAAMLRHPEADVVSGRLLADAGAENEEIPVTVVEVHRDKVLAGRRVRPWLIGLTAAMAIRRAALERLGGYDERLGPGRAFPSAEDVDFNYRFLRDGGMAYVTTGPTATHEQWRTPSALGPHFRGYMIGWSGFATKHLRQGDLVGGAWLWSLGLLDVVRMIGSAVRRRSRFRSRVALFKLQGLVVGTVRGLRARW